MKRSMKVLASASMCVFAASAHAGVVTANYSFDAGGTNGESSAGMTATAIFEVTGTTMNVQLINTSTSLPGGAGFADSLLVSVGFNLPTNVTIVSGDSALISAGSVGAGAWDHLGAGDSVAEEWLWTNEGGGDVMAALSQIISTSNGQGGGTLTDFNGNNASVNGPSGGMTASPVLHNVPGSQEAVTNSISFSLTLSETIGDDALQLMADTSMVEFGSNFQYLTTTEVPSPAGLALLGLAAVGRRRRR